MAENTVSASGDVLYQDGDDLSEANITRSAARSNATDYVERGMGVTVDAAAGTIDINSGHCIIQDGINAYDVFPNQVTDITLPAPNGTNYVFISIDETTDDSITYEVDDADTAPTQPALKIATADGSAGTSTPANPRPDIEVDEADITKLVAALDANSNDINNIASTDIDSAVIASELGLPGYDDPTNAPQTQNRLIYVTGAGADEEGIYKHDGSSYAKVGTTVLADSGNDTDGGDDYQLPQAADNIDLQGDGAVRNADLVSTENISIANAAAVVYPSTDQGVTDSATTKVEFDSTEVNHTDVLNADTSNNNITVQQAGVYIVVAHLDFRNSTNISEGDRYQHSIYLNGSEVSRSSEVFGAAGQGEGSVVLYISDLSDGDTIDARVTQTTGGSIDTAGTQERTRFQVVKLA